MTQKHNGLVLSAIGALVFVIGALLLLALPSYVGSTGILAGGLMVWAGLIWTLFGYYTPPDEAGKP